MDWHTKLKSNNVNECTIIFYDILYKLINKYVPRKIKYKGKFPIFFSQKLKRLIKIKKIYQAQYKKFKLDPRPHYYYKKFSKQRKYCTYIYDLDYKNYIKKIESDLQTDQKPYWSYMDTNKKEDIPSEMYYNNQKFNNDTDIANAFANYFQSTFKISNVNTNIKINHNNNNFLSSFHITEKDIENSLKKIKINQSPGTDKIYPHFIKNCSQYLILPLFIIFNLSISQGELPDLWKKGLIVPIFKNGENNIITNYRPVTLLSTFKNY